MVDGEVTDPGSHQPTARPQLVVESNRVGSNGGVGNESRVRVASSNTDRRKPSDEPM